MTHSIPRPKLALICGAALLAAAAWPAIRWARTDGPADREQTRNTASTAVVEPGSAPVAAEPARTAGEDSVPLRPLPVSTSSGRHEWTSDDARDIGIIERIAHNPEEALKMIEENDRILRRQLVYRKTTAAQLIQDARLSGEPVTRLTLPGLDGQELEVEVISSDLAPSGQSGSFHGRLAGSPGSLVTLAFEFGVEAFTVIAPEDNIFLQADPREAGELIVRSFVPDKFMPFTCGNPDHQH